jgi:hypothetical protein
MLRSLLKPLCGTQSSVSGRCYDLQAVENPPSPLSPNDPGIDPGLAAMQRFHDAIKSGVPVPPVAVEDVKYMWNSWQRILKRVPRPKEAGGGGITVDVFGDDNPFYRLGEKAPAVWFRCAQIGMLVQHGCLAKDQVDDAVFRIAATFPVVPKAGGSFDLSNFTGRVRRQVLLNLIQRDEATIERLEHGWESSVDMMGELRDKLSESDKKLKAAEQRIRELEEKLKR